MPRKKFKSILVIPDLHCPFHHKDAFKFLDSVKRKYKPDHVVCLGDELDYHCISFHDNDPDIAFSPSSELEKAIWHLSDMYALFERVDMLDSNHGSLVYRKAKHHGLPRRVFRSYNEILEAPKGYIWHDDLTLTMSNGENVYFHHGHSKNALRNSQIRSMSYVQGHHHGTFDCQWWANSERLFFGVTSGCLIDRKEFAFNYARNNLPKPLLGCTVILNGIPKLIPMILNKRGKWTGKII
jgi:hypothetical protein